MRRIIPILIVSTVLSACSVDISTELVPTTASATTSLEVPDNEAFAILLLEWREASDEFAAWFEEQGDVSQQIVTVGEYVEWVEESHLANNRILDEWDGVVSSIDAYVGSPSLAVTDVEISRFVSLAEDFSVGYRLQADPAFLCVDLIPADVHNEPFARVLDIPGYPECLSDASSNPLVQRSLDAGTELATAYNALYVPIFGGG